MPQPITKLGKSPNQFITTVGQPPNTWKIGYISLVSPDRLPLGAVAVASNVMQEQDGVWGTRWGSANYGPAYTGLMTGLTDFTVYTSPTNYTTGLMAVINGVVNYTTDLTSWTPITGADVTTSAWTVMEQYDNKVLLANGVNNFSYVNLSNFSYGTFTGISTPTAPTATVGSGITGTNYTIYYQVTASTESGETPGSTIIAVEVSIDRPNWNSDAGTTSVTSSTNYITLSWPAVSGAIGYTVYASDNESGVTYELAQVGAATTTVTYTDYGIEPINDLAQVPLTDTTVAPKFSWIALSDNILYACGDPNNMYRIYFASAQPGNQLAFNSFLGGGWVDILPGGAQIPAFVGQFRTGQGTPATTILMSEPTGYGSTWHLILTTDTIGNTAITVPSVMEALQTFGSGSPRSVISTNENIYFHSGGPAGIYSTGSVPTLFNILSTNEISLLVRPDLRSIPIQSIDQICGIEYDRKLFYSAPFGDTVNNQIAVYDLEKENWVINAFDFGVNGWTRYADSEGQLHLLGVRSDQSSTGTNYLQDFSNKYTTDNGSPINAQIQTGLIHLSPAHTQFGYIQYLTYEFGPSVGTIQVSIDGTPYGELYQPLWSFPITFGDTTGYTGYGMNQYSGAQYSTSQYAVVVSALADKESILVSSTINNYAVAISSQTAGTRFVWNQFAIEGVMIPLVPPSNWRLN